jgi:hypothetical protein
MCGYGGGVGWQREPVCLSVYVCVFVVCTYIYVCVYVWV